MALQTDHRGDLRQCNVSKDRGESENANGRVKHTFITSLHARQCVKEEEEEEAGGLSGRRDLQCHNKISFELSTDQGGAFVCARGNKSTCHCELRSERRYGTNF
jgi:hypothetical protein